MEETDNGLIWKIATIALGVLFVIVVVVVIILGLKLGNYNKAKASEISTKLANQDTELKKQCQTEKEQTELTYKAGDVYGNFSFNYPKVWSTNVTEDPGNSARLTFLGSPDLIIENRNNPPVVALRVIYFDQDFESKVKSYGDRYKTSEATVSGLKGTRLTGVDQETQKNVSFVLIPLRDKTIYIGTDNTAAFQSQYDKILKSFVLNK